MNDKLLENLDIARPSDWSPLPDDASKFAVEFDTCLLNYWSYLDNLIEHGEEIPSSIPIDLLAHEIALRPFQDKYVTLARTLSHITETGVHEVLGNAALTFDAFASGGDYRVAWELALNACDFQVQACQSTRNLGYLTNVAWPLIGDARIYTGAFRNFETYSKCQDFIEAAGENHYITTEAAKSMMDISNHFIDEFAPTWQDLGSLLQKQIRDDFIKHCDAEKFPYRMGSSELSEFRQQSS